MRTEAEACTHVLERNCERTSLIQQGTRVIQRTVITPFTGTHARSTAVAIDVEIEIFQLAAALDIRCGRVADELTLIGLATRRDLHTILVHGRRVAAIRVLQRSARHDGWRKGRSCVAVRVCRCGRRAHNSTLAG